MSVIKVKNLSRVAIGGDQGGYERVIEVREYPNSLSVSLLLLFKHALTYTHANTHTHTHIDADTLSPSSLTHLEHQPVNKCGLCAMIFKISESECKESE